MKYSKTGGGVQAGSVLRCINVASVYLIVSAQYCKTFFFVCQTWFYTTSRSASGLDPLVAYLQNKGFYKGFFYPEYMFLQVFNEIKGFRDLQWSLNYCAADEHVHAKNQ